MNHIEQYLNYLQNSKNYSVHTVTSSRTDLLQFKEFLLQNDVVSFLGVELIHIRSWLITLSENNLSPKSINRKISSLRSFFKYLQRNDLVNVNPMSKISGPKIPKRLPRYVDKDKLNRILDDEIISKVDYASARENIIINLLYHTGIRRSELIGLDVEKIDFHLKSIKVLGKGNKERIIPLTDQLLVELESYLKIRKDTFNIDKGPLILTDGGMRAYPKLIYNIVVKILRKYNASDKPSPHVLRHTFATHLSSSGAELNAVKELLGHSSLAATQIYTHNSIERLKEVYDKSHPKSKL